MLSTNAGAYVPVMLPTRPIPPFRPARAGFLALLPILLLPSCVFSIGACKHDRTALAEREPLLRERRRLLEQGVEQAGRELQLTLDQQAGGRASELEVAAARRRLLEAELALNELDLELAHRR
jgi:hypothetical protein